MSGYPPDPLKRPHGYMNMPPVHTQSPPSHHNPHGHPLHHQMMHQPQQQHIPSHDPLGVSSTAPPPLPTVGGGGLDDLEQAAKRLKTSAELPSAGSIFHNPPPYVHGGALLSSANANRLVAQSNASSASPSSSSPTGSPPGVGRGGMPVGMMGMPLPMNLPSINGMMPMGMNGMLPMGMNNVMSPMFPFHSNVGNFPGMTMQQNAAHAPKFRKPTLLSSYPIRPLRVFYFTVPCDLRSRLNESDLDPPFAPVGTHDVHVRLPLRIMGSTNSMKDIYIVAYDICRILNIRKSNTSKTVAFYNESEKSSMPILCTTRKEGIHSVHQLTVLSLLGVQKLLDTQGKQDAVAQSIWKWVKQEVQYMINLEEVRRNQAVAAEEKKHQENSSSSSASSFITGLLPLSQTTKAEGSDSNDPLAAAEAANRALEILVPTSEHSGAVWVGFDRSTTKPKKPELPPLSPVMAVLADLYPQPQPQPTFSPLYHQSSSVETRIVYSHIFNQICSIFKEVRDNPEMRNKLSENLAARRDKEIHRGKARDQPINVSHGGDVAQISDGSSGDAFDNLSSDEQEDDQRFLGIPDFVLPVEKNRPGGQGQVQTPTSGNVLIL